MRDNNNLYLNNKGMRIWELDFIRGVCILLMILDHMLYDLAYIFSYRWFSGSVSTGVMYELTSFAKEVYYPWPLRDMGWWVAVFCFVFICGLSCSFSKSNLKRGIRLLAVALVLTVATGFLDRYYGTENQFIIRFGVLHMMAVSILLYHLLQKANLFIKLGLSILSIGAGFYFMEHPLSSSFYYIGILFKSSSGFYSSDYFPLLPWFGFFLAGAALGPILYPDKKSFFPARGGRISSWKKPVLFVGRNSLIFYVVHQPLVYGLLTLAGMILINK